MRHYSKTHLNLTSFLFSTGLQFLFFFEDSTKDDKCKGFPEVALKLRIILIPTYFTSYQHYQKVVEFFVSLFFPYILFVLSMLPKSHTSICSVANDIYFIPIQLRVLLLVILRTLVFLKTLSTHTLRRF